MLSRKWRPFCLGLNVLMFVHISYDDILCWLYPMQIMSRIMQSVAEYMVEKWQNLGIELAWNDQIKEMF